MAKRTNHEGSYELAAHLVTKVSVTELGRHRFAVMPRIGEWVEIEDALYLVLMVSRATAGAAGDVYLQRIGDRGQFALENRLTLNYQMGEAAILSSTTGQH